LIVMAAGVVPCLALLWWRARGDGAGTVSLAWASTLTWTVVLNLYAPAYDTPIILLGILLMLDVLARSHGLRLPVAAPVLLVLLYVAPWVPAVPIGRSASLQLYTIVLIALGAYQLSLGTRGIQGFGSPLTS
jgi:hypothetical protein